jgi:hypothetical protein
MSNPYITDARKRLDAIKRLAAGKPDQHVYSMSKYGKVCLGCGKLRVQITADPCTGDLYDAEPAKLIHFKLAAVAILQMENALVLNRLEAADRALEGCVMFMTRASGLDPVSSDVVLASARRALEAIRKSADAE